MTEDKYRFKSFIEVPKGATGVKSNDWWTPKWLFDKMNIEFDVDVASPLEPVSWIPANKFYTEIDDGLAQDWEGKVWMNPPYSTHTPKWLKKFCEHKNGIALVFARTDTKWFHDYAVQGDALNFMKGRIAFVSGETGKAGQSAGAGSLLIAFGQECVEAIKKIEGFVVENTGQQSY